MEAERADTEDRRIVSWTTPNSGSFYTPGKSSKSHQSELHTLQRQVGLITGFAALAVIVVNTIDRTVFDGISLTDALLSWSNLVLVAIVGLMLFSAIGPLHIARPTQVTVYFVEGVIAALDSEPGNLTGVVYAAIAYLLLLEYGHLERRAVPKTIAAVAAFAVPYSLGGAALHSLPVTAIVVTLLGGGTVIAIGMVLVRFRFRRHRHRERELEEAVQARTASLQDSLAEKELLLNELHHRTKNNMQLVSSVLHMETRRLSDPTAVSVLTDGMHRVRALALAHEHLYGSEDLKHVDLATYTRALIDDIWESVATTETGLSVEFRESIPVDLDFAIPFGLVLNELVSNAAKHAKDEHPKDGTSEASVRIESWCSEGLLHVTVGDNGPGMSKAVDLASPKSMGLRLVVGLVQQLDGSISVSNDSGAKWEMEFSFADGQRE